jgi:hypothetical protein
MTFNKFQTMMQQLDMALTEKDERQTWNAIHNQHAKTAEQWLEDGGEWYLSDGGLSRVCWSEEDLHLFCTSNSTDKVKQNWSRCREQITAIENELRETFKRITGHAYNIS